MAEVLIAFEEPIAHADGTRYQARVCGRVGDDGLWEGWIEFHPVAGGAPLPSPRETQQPNRTDLMYWATGLSVAYLEGALDRARRAAAPSVPAPPAPSVPLTVPATPAHAPAPAATVAVPRPVLDPFVVYAQGEDVLRNELLALGTDHLNGIIAAYGLDRDVPIPVTAEHATRVAAIVVAVKRRVQGE